MNQAHCKLPNHKLGTRKKNIQVFTSQIVAFWVGKVGLAMNMRGMLGWWRGGVVLLRWIENRGEEEEEKKGLN